MPTVLVAMPIHRCAGSSSTLRPLLQRHRSPLASREPEPVAIDQAEPRWNSSVMQTLRKGRVQLLFEVGPDGNIVRTAVVRSSVPQLTVPAPEAMQQ